MRTQAEQDALDRIAAGADEAAGHALAHFADEDWRGVDFAEALLGAARTLRQAGRRPSPCVVEAMARCTAAHRARMDAGARAEEPRMMRAQPTAAVAGDGHDPDVREPVRTKVGLGGIVQGVLRAQRR